MRRLGLGLGTTRLQGFTWEAEALSLFGRMSVQPDGARKQLINRTIRSLKTEGIWDRLDAFYMLAAHNEQAARCNWKADAHNLVVVGSPAFAADRGFEGDGAGSYLDTGFIPGTMGQFALDDAHLGVFCLTDVAEDAPDCGNLNTRVFTRTVSGRISGRMNDSAIPSVLPVSASSIGHTVFSRNSSSSYRMDRNGVAVGTAMNGSSSLAAATFTVLGAGAIFSSKQLASVHFGRALEQSHSQTLCAMLVEYLDCITPPE